MTTLDVLHYLCRSTQGGVGKTTLAVSLAAELCRRHRDVALIDSDPQRSACHWAEPGNLDFSVYEIALADRPVTVWAQDVKRVPAHFLVIDTAPEDQALGASIALSNLVLVPCTPSRAGPRSDRPNAEDHQRRPRAAAKAGRT